MTGMAKYNAQDQIHRRTPAICPRCNDKLQQKITANGEPIFIHPARPSKDGTYTTAVFRCAYAGAVLFLEQLRQIAREGFIPVGTEHLQNIIPEGKRLSRATLEDLSRLKTIERAKKNYSDIDRIVNAWYARSYNYLLDRKNNVLH